MPVPSQESKWSFICLLSYLASFYDISIEFCFFCFVFHFICFLWKENCVDFFALIVKQSTVVFVIVKKWDFFLSTPISQILFNIYLATFLLQSPNSSNVSLWNYALTIQGNIKNYNYIWSYTKQLQYIGARKKERKKKKMDIFPYLYITSMTGSYYSMGPGGSMS